MAPHPPDTSPPQLSRPILDQADSPQRLICTDTTIHLAATPGPLTSRQLDNLHHAGHCAASLSPNEATAAARLLHRTVLGLPVDASAAQIPRLTNRGLLAPVGPPRLTPTCCSPWA
ncbi:hypothetical protein [Streptomyces sp. DSS69]|uniref:hypothetical protein n=1 Tax=Streptomyces sp. DSS69 TaxID=3113369 RepID=UPI0031F90F90